MITGFSVFLLTCLLAFGRHRMPSLYDAWCKSPRPRMYNHWFSGSRDAQCTTRWHHCRGPHRSACFPGVERIFSLYGMLSSGRRNRMLTSLEMRVCLKLNSGVAY